MNKIKWLKVFSATMLLSLLLFSSVNAFTVGSVEGVWGMIDRGAGGMLIDLVGVIGQDPGDYWDGGGDLRTDNRTLVRQSTVCGPDWDGSPTLVGWDGYPNATYTHLGAHNAGSCSPTELFISEYVETNSGTPNRRALEIYNGTGAAVDLSAYSILIFNGGSVTETSVISLSGTLASGAVFIVANGAISGVTVNQTSTLGFNGDDAVGLFTNYTADSDGIDDDATCSEWGTGSPASPSTTFDYWWSQNPPSGEENHVRYGRDAYWQNNQWNARSCANTEWTEKSGFGFDGANSADPTAKIPFYLGTFTHYNRQVYSTNDAGFNSNPLSYIDLMVSVPFTCNDGTTSTIFNFEPRITLDETNNAAGTCVYSDPAFPNPVPCPDKVTITQPVSTATFNCPDGVYTVNINGFTRTGLGTDTCEQSFNPAAVSTEYITQEDANNPACLWATIDAPTADITPSKTCQYFDNQTTGDEFYRIVVTNEGPGAARQPQLTDTLPVGANYAGPSRPWTSKLTTTAYGTVNQGTCTVVGKLVTCSLLTPLPDWDTDPLAKWTVDIPVNLTTGSKVNTVTVTSATTDPNTANNTATATCDSTAASLIAFTAERGENGVLVKWETASELNSLGFNVLRSKSIDGEKVTLNQEIFYAQPWQDSGSVYEFVDETALPGVRYFYWLEDIDLSNIVIVYGPLTVD